MAQDFFDLLYNGYTGEYQLMSSLYRNGLDALRPPADMGIDVVSLNLKQQLEHPGMAPETFFFQVKTAVTNVSEAADRPGAIATVEFKLKQSEVDLLACSARPRAVLLRLQLRGRFAHGRVQSAVHLLLARRYSPREGSQRRRVLSQRG